ncbi:hypothetical protein HPB50_028588 [Hyalomma asiaticum]|nr:hypothetical protein HPB50_028588 [Hyalomma asiaticum]
MKAASYTSGHPPGSWSAPERACMAEEILPCTDASFVHAMSTTERLDGELAKLSDLDSDASTAETAACEAVLSSSDECSDPDLDGNTCESAVDGNASSSQNEWASLGGRGFVSSPCDMISFGEERDIVATLLVASEAEAAA